MSNCVRHGDTVGTCHLCHFEKLYDEMKARIDELEKKARPCPRCEDERMKRESAYKTRMLEKGLRFMLRKAIKDCDMTQTTQMKPRIEPEQCSVCFGRDSECFNCGGSGLVCGFCGGKAHHGHGEQGECPECNDSGRAPTH